MTEMNKDEKLKLVRAMFQEARERARREPPMPPPAPPRRVHFTELPEAKPGEELAQEWNTYRREVPRLLAEGLEGRHVLIKGEEILGIFDTWEAAYQVGSRRYLMEPILVKTILTEEPYLRVRGLNYPLPIRLEKSA